MFKKSYFPIVLKLMQGLKDKKQELGLITCHILKRHYLHTNQLQFILNCQPWHFQSRKLCLLMFKICDMFYFTIAQLSSIQFSENKLINSKIPEMKISRNFCFFSIHNSIVGYQTLLWAQIEVALI